MLLSSHAFQLASTICIKLGTSRVVDSNLQPRTDFIANLANDIKTHLSGKRIFLVASGAVALGRYAAGFHKDQPLTTKEKQIAFGFGHQYHTNIFLSAFKDAGLKPATGHLVAAHNFSSEEQKRNLQTSVNSMLNMNATVVFNENDLTATEELESENGMKWGDNDSLSAQLSCVMQSDILLILTDVDGVYTDNPNSGGVHIPYIGQITETHLHMANGKGSALSTGGMYSKLNAARIAQNCGITTIIAEGSNSVLRDLKNDRARCTIVSPNQYRFIANHSIS